MPTFKNKGDATFVGGDITNNSNNTTNKFGPLQIKPTDNSLLEKIPGIEFLKSLLKAINLSDSRGVKQTLLNGTRYAPHLAVLYGIYQYIDPEHDPEVLKKMIEDAYSVFLSTAQRNQYQADLNTRAAIGAVQGGFNIFGSGPGTERGFEQIGNAAQTGIQAYYLPDITREKIIQTLVVSPVILQNAEFISAFASALSSRLFSEYATSSLNPFNPSRIPSGTSDFYFKANKNSLEIYGANEQLLQSVPGLWGAITKPAFSFGSPFNLYDDAEKKNLMEIINNQKDDVIRGLSDSSALLLPDVLKGIGGNVYKDFKEKVNGHIYKMLKKAIPDKDNNVLEESETYLKLRVLSKNNNVTQHTKYDNGESKIYLKFYKDNITMPIKNYSNESDLPTIYKFTDKFYNFFANITNEVVKPIFVIINQNIYEITDPTPEIMSLMHANEGDERIEFETTTTFPRENNDFYLDDIVDATPSPLFPFMTSKELLNGTNTNKRSGTIKPGYYMAIDRTTRPIDLTPGLIILNGKSLDIIVSRLKDPQSYNIFDESSQKLSDSVWNSIVSTLTSYLGKKFVERFTKATTLSPNDLIPNTIITDLKFVKEPYESQAPQAPQNLSEINDTFRFSISHARKNKVVSFFKKHYPNKKTIQTYMDKARNEIETENAYYNKFLRLYVASLQNKDKFKQFIDDFENDALQISPQFIKERKSRSLVERFSDWTQTLIKPQYCGKCNNLIDTSDYHLQDKKKKKHVRFHFQCMCLFHKRIKEGPKLDESPRFSDYASENDYKREKVENVVKNCLEALKDETLKQKINEIIKKPRENLDENDYKTVAEALGVERNTWRRVIPDFSFLPVFVQLLGALLAIAAFYQVFKVANQFVNFQRLFIPSSKPSSWEVSIFGDSPNPAFAENQLAIRLPEQEHIPTVSSDTFYVADIAPQGDQKIITLFNGTTINKTTINPTIGTSIQTGDSFLRSFGKNVSFNNLFLVNDKVYTIYTFSNKTHIGMANKTEAGLFFTAVKDDYLTKFSKDFQPRFNDGRNKYKQLLKNEFDIARPKGLKGEKLYLTSTVKPEFKDKNLFQAVVVNLGFSSEQLDDKTKKYIQSLLKIFKKNPDSITTANGAPSIDSEIRVGRYVYLEVENVPEPSIQEQVDENWDPIKEHRNFLQNYTQKLNVSTDGLGKIFNYLVKRLSDQALTTFNGIVETPINDLFVYDDMNPGEYERLRTNITLKEALGVINEQYNTYGGPQAKMYLPIQDEGDIRSEYLNQPEPYGV